MATQFVQYRKRFLWVDPNINQNDADTQHSLEQLRKVVHPMSIDLFTTIEACLTGLNQIKKEKAVIITSGSLGQQFVKQIHHLPQIDAIYIFCSNPDLHRVWTKTWPKIKGVHNRMKFICEALQRTVRKPAEDFMSMSFIERNQSDQDKSAVDLNRLEPSFMYTTLFKRIILDMKHEPDERHAIVIVCRKHYADKPEELNIVEDFDRIYRPDRAIWWYTRQCFIHEILNRSLRLLESEIIVDMGFFIHDLHRQLEQLHQEQFSNYIGTSLTLYRGQALSLDDFGQLQRSRGGLLAFNGFLSTSRDKSVSMPFAQAAVQRENMIGILFVMTVDPKMHSATFADVENHDYYGNEHEVLFSMHTVFRITDIIELDKKQRLHEVRLTMTSDDDPELRRLTDRIEEEIGDGTGWERLGRVLLAIGHVNKAEELYLALLKKGPCERDQTLYYQCLGLIKDRQGDCKAAVEYYERAISIATKVFSLKDASLPISYNNIGSVYLKMGEYSKALSYYTKALSIRENVLPTNHIDIAESYNNIGSVYLETGDYSQGLSYYTKALFIRKQTLPKNHPALTTSYNNMGAVYSRMGEHVQALPFYSKALAIQEKTLPANHPSLAASYNNIGSVYENMGQYSQALVHYEKSVSIKEKTHPLDYLSLATSYNNIGLAYRYMGNHSQALSYYFKALEIKKKTRPENHPSFATSYNNIGSVYSKMGEHMQALSYYRKAVAICQKSLLVNHLLLTTSYINVGTTYYELQQYPEAQFYFRKAYSIQESTLPREHPHLASTKQWLKDVKAKLQR